MGTPGSRAGSRFGPYELRSMLGKGGMGEVYEAYDTGKDRVVALKLLAEELAQDPAYQVRFRRESQAAAKLAEPHVIPIHDWGVINGVLFIDMRLVPGTDLRTVLHQGGPLSPDRAVAVVEQIAAALDAAHAGGLVHRDVKPANILVTPADFAYLADFGIAHTEGDSAVTQTGMAMGSYIYMAPERFDVGPISHRADIYSLACVLHECLTGGSPFPAASMSVLIRAHLSEAPPRPSAIIHGLPPGLDDIIARGMAKDPADRYASAGALAVAAREVLNAAIQHAPANYGARPGTFGGSQNPGAPSAGGPVPFGGGSQSGGVPFGAESGRNSGAVAFGAGARPGAAEFEAGSQSGAVPFGAEGGRNSGAVAFGAGAQSGAVPFGSDSSRNSGAVAHGGAGSQSGRDSGTAQPGVRSGSQSGAVAFGAGSAAEASAATFGAAAAARRGGSTGGNPVGSDRGAQSGPVPGTASSGSSTGAARKAKGDTGRDEAGESAEQTPTPTGEFRVVGAVAATGGIETSRSQTTATGAQPTLIIRPPEQRPGGNDTTGFRRVPVEGAGEVSVPAVIQPTGPTEIRAADTHFTPLPPADGPAEPPAPEPPPAYTPDQGLPRMRPFPDAHLYNDFGEPSSQTPADHPFPPPQPNPAPATQRYHGEPPLPGRPGEFPPPSGTERPAPGGPPRTGEFPTPGSPATQRYPGDPPLPGRQAPPERSGEFPLPGSPATQRYPGEPPLPGRQAPPERSGEFPLAGSPATQRNSADYPQPGTPQRSGEFPIPGRPGAPTERYPGEGPAFGPQGSDEFPVPGRPGSPTERYPGEYPTPGPPGSVQRSGEFSVPGSPATQRYSGEGSAFGDHGSGEFPVPGRPGAPAERYPDDHRLPGAQGSAQRSGEFPVPGAPAERYSGEGPMPGPARSGEFPFAGAPATQRYPGENPERFGPPADEFDDHRFGANPGARPGDSAFPGDDRANPDARFGSAPGASGADRANPPFGAATRKFGGDDDQFDAFGREGDDPAARTQMFGADAYADDRFGPADDPQRYAATQHFGGAGQVGPPTEQYDPAGLDAQRAAPTQHYQGGPADPQRAQPTHQYRGGAAPFPAHQAPAEYDDHGGQEAAYSQYDEHQQAYGDHAYRDPAYDPGYGPDQHWPEEDRRPRRSLLLPVLVGVLTVVVLAIGGAIGWRLMSATDSADTTAGAPTTLAPATGQPAGTTPRATTAAPTTSAGPVTLPAGAQPCESGSAGGTFGNAAVGNTVTSCPFAEAVREAYASGGSGTATRPVVATSPVTGRTYTMTCTPEGKLVTCTGGENAIVYVY
ncbi:protein kinase [Nocardia sp. NPDC059177]|uniref:serine/threonine-protein kinase n=1 Tax=Nocardia sp. NPDC059177 TaxID=3346759 RepID=UPI0036B42262